jgi:hypothetical protein
MATKLDPAANWEIKRDPVRVRQCIAGSTVFAHSKAETLGAMQPRDCVLGSGRPDPQ